MSEAAEATNLWVNMGAAVGTTALVVLGYFAKGAGSKQASATSVTSILENGFIVMNAAVENAARASAEAIDALKIQMKEQSDNFAAFYRAYEIDRAYSRGQNDAGGRPTGISATERRHSRHASPDA